MLAIVIGTLRNAVSRTSRRAASAGRFLGGTLEATLREGLRQRIPLVMALVANATLRVPPQSHELLLALDRWGPTAAVGGALLLLQSAIFLAIVAADAPAWSGRTGPQRVARRIVTVVAMLGAPVGLQEGSNSGAAA